MLNNSQVVSDPRKMELRVCYSEKSSRTALQEFPKYFCFDFVEIE